MRIVDAENIKDTICQITNDAIEKHQTKNTIQKRLILAVEMLPTVNARPLTCAKWELAPDHTYHCTYCRKETRNATYNFCPWCGAEMVEE